MASSLGTAVVCGEGSSACISAAVVFRPVFVEEILCYLVGNPYQSANQHRAKQSRGLVIEYGLKYSEEVSLPTGYRNHNE
jgi:hypothetical protein